jgi:uncharacterized protein (TIGR03067 family)
MRFLLLTPLAYGLAFVIPVRADDAKNDLEKFQGTWRMDLLVDNGRKASAEEAGKFQVTIKGDKFVVKSELLADISITIKLMPREKGKEKENPAAIDLTQDDDAKKERKVLGIYKIDGDTLTICASNDDKKRPTEFAGGKGVILVVLKRQK